MLLEEEFRYGGGVSFDVYVLVMEGGWGLMKLNIKTSSSTLVNSLM